MQGGTGDDLYLVNAAGDKTVDFAAEGNDTVQTGLSWTLGNNIEALILTGTASATGTGNGENNTITGNTGANVLSGMTGNDTLFGGAQNDTLDGGTGNDSMVGGTNNDYYIVDVAGDVVVELLNEGIDTVRSSISYTLGSNVDNLILGGLSTLTGTGNILANVITGNAGRNALNGGDGNDTLNGEDGNDTLNGDAGNDSMVGGLGDDSYTVAEAGTAPSRQRAQASTPSTPTSTTPWRSTSKT